MIKNYKYENFNISRPRREVLLPIVLPWRIMPYVRTNYRDFSAKAKAYHNSQFMICDYIDRSIAANLDMSVDEYKLFIHSKCPVRVGTAVFIPEGKGKLKGQVTKNKGDWDNYQKAVCDALVYYKYLPGDSAHTVRGPDIVIVPPEWDYGNVVESGVYLSNSKMQTEYATAFTVWATA